MAQNPYAVTEQSLSSLPRRPIYSFGAVPWLALLTAGGLAGASLMAGLYLGYVAWFESAVMPLLCAPGAPILSYGEMLGLMFLLAAFLGCACGISTVLAVTGRTVASAAVTIGGCLAAAFFVHSFWSDMVARYGHNPNEHILYWPFVTLIPVALACWPLTAVTRCFLRTGAR